MGQAFTVLLAAHLVEQVQGQYAKDRYQNQRRAHATIDAQEDRIHSVQASGTNK
ncbi:hypothetical protein D3C84_1183970 [compost metagenome]